MKLLIDLLSWASIVVGGIFCIVGAVGMLRMPDFYTRVHAASLVDTLGPVSSCSACCCRPASRWWP